ncbi:uncharacterized protein BX663DRAFT_516962 [Cokeromyces recurvatus]|uniref:uncharacterized protein n=1 Tax=Cokeromyces recurvatus TaxID=90255 RepID=UPI00221FBAEF|nr:uncharacterized protein BX663DRAFT_516962 [Cokeromyces recurvatus]KAI7900596.1 hypothetical protein BX663DRAFT_516962 [Cokeromyces recurvatus]
MLMYISSMEKVCIVVIDFAGLTTNCEDLKVFLKQVLFFFKKKRIEMAPHGP